MNMIMSSKCSCKLTPGRSACASMCVYVRAWDLVVGLDKRRRVSSPALARGPIHTDSTTPTQHKPYAPRRSAGFALIRTRRAGAGYTPTARGSRHSVRTTPGPAARWPPRGRAPARPESCSARRPWLVELAVVGVVCGDVADRLRSRCCAGRVASPLDDRSQHRRARSWLLSLGMDAWVNGARRERADGGRGWMSTQHPTPPHARAPSPKRSRRAAARSFRRASCV